MVDRFVQVFLGRGVSVQRRVRCSTAQTRQVQQIADRAARCAVRDLGTDIVLAGHYHVPRGPEEVDGSVYVNTGDFGPDHQTWVELHDGVPLVSWAKEV